MFLRAASLGISLGTSPCIGEYTHGQTTIQRRDQARRARIESRLDTIRARSSASRGPERTRRSVRRHRAGGVVPIRRQDQHADAAEAGGSGPDVLAVAHDRALLTDAIDVS